MTKKSLEARVAALEAEMEQLKKNQPPAPSVSDPWLETVWGAFANDPDFEEAMRLGREWRESFRPKSSKRKKATP
ncbi:MAG: hypothetical protein ACK4RK_07755 [Gemmataceae bacterium]